MSFGAAKEDDGRWRSHAVADYGKLADFAAVSGVDALFVAAEIASGVIVAGAWHFVIAFVVDVVDVVIVDLFH